MIIEDMAIDPVEDLPSAIVGFVLLVFISSILISSGKTVEVSSVIGSVARGPTVLLVSVGHIQFRIHPVMSDRIRTHGYSHTEIGHVVVFRVCDSVTVPTVIKSSCDELVDLTVAVVVAWVVRKVGHIVIFSAKVSSAILWL
jgi:hypothetical protein